jgi:hypothetical protein
MALLRVGFGRIGVAREAVVRSGRRICMVLWGKDGREMGVSVAVNVSVRVGMYGVSVRGRIFIDIGRSFNRGFRIPETLDRKVNQRWARRDPHALSPRLAQ